MTIIWWFSIILNSYKLYYCRSLYLISKASLIVNLQGINYLFKEEDCHLPHFEVWPTGRIVCAEEWTPQQQLTLRHNLTLKCWLLWGFVVFVVFGSLGSEKNLSSEKKLPCATILPGNVNLWGFVVKGWGDLVEMEVYVLIR